MLLEIVVTVVIIAALLLFVGVPLESILTLLAVIMLGLVSLSMALFTLFFVITDISLLFRRCVKGKFLHVDDTGRFDHAVYQAEGEEYSCLFPAESFGRSRIYRPDQEYLLLISRSGKNRTAYDRHSLMIIVVGTLFSVFFIFLLTFAASFLRGIV